MFMRGEAVLVFGMLVAGRRVRVQTRNVTSRADDGDTDQQGQDTLHPLSVRNDAMSVKCRGRAPESQAATWRR
jgi:hypothetical protein